MQLLERVPTPEPRDRPPAHPGRRNPVASGGAPLGQSALAASPDALRGLALVLAGDAEALRARGGPDWAACTVLAWQHGLSPMLYHCSRPLAEEWPIPPEQEHALHTVYLKAAVDGQARMNAAVAAVERLSAAGITVIALKGLHLSCAVYDAPFLRPMLDLDLLVRPGQLEAARAALLADGYVHEAPDDPTLHHAAPLTKRRVIPIELHRSLSPNRTPFRIDMDRLWERAEPVWVGPQPVLGFCPEDLVMHLSLHAAYNHRCLVPARNIYDIALVVRRHGPALRWELMEETARAWGAHRALFCGLALAREMFGAEVPAELLDRLAPAAERDAALRTARANVLAYTAAGPYWMGMALGDVGPASIVGGVLGRVFAPPDRLLETSGRKVTRALLAWTYLTRPVVLAYRHRRLLADLLLARPGAREQLRLARTGAALDAWIAAG